MHTGKAKFELESKQKLEFCGECPPGVVHLDQLSLRPQTNTTSA